MTILSDKEIIELCTRPSTSMMSPEQIEELNDWKPMLENFVDRQIRFNDKDEKVISYGLSSYGYDLRAAPEFLIFTNVNSAVVDPKKFDETSFVKIEAKEVLIPPNSFMLTHSLEKFNMPKNITGVVLGKSTLARSGLSCICTPAEAGWSGYLTLEFANNTPLPVKFYAEEGCCQVVFIEGNPCITTYADRNGKYQDQPASVILPRL